MASLTLSAPSLLRTWRVSANDRLSLAERLRPQSQRMRATSTQLEMPLTKQLWSSKLADGY